MNKEFEAGFLNIDEKSIKNQLKKLGAKKILPKRLMRRYIFETPEMKKSRHWLRLRDEGNHITLTLKKVADPTKIGGKEETEVIVTDFDDMAKILEAIGLEPTNYQESYRETWSLEEVLFEFDLWPDLPIFFEIEAPNKKLVEKYVAKLGLDMNQAWFGTIGHVYEEVLKRDIKKEKRLVFKNKSK